MDLYTVVQHSGYGYGQDYQFRQGLESRKIDGRSKPAILKAGGLIFESYSEAEGYANKEMYPEGYGGLIPRAPGSFGSYKVDELAIYIPPAEPEVNLVFTAYFTGKTEKEALQGMMWDCAENAQTHVDENGLDHKVFSGKFTLDKESVEEVDAGAS